jgi:hypothetical protein
MRDLGHPAQSGWKVRPYERLVVPFWSNMAHFGTTYSVLL